MEKKLIKSIAIGGFDGMHLGHKKLFGFLDNNGAVVVIQSDYENLTPGVFRKKFINNPIYFYKLDSIKEFEGDKFINILLNDFPNLEKIVVGYDFRFGKNKKYSAYDLKKIINLEIIIVDEVKLNNISIHSKIIRKSIRQGDIKLANKLLGHNYTIFGHITKGQGIGHKELFPTINLQFDKFLIPSFGVYASFSIVDDKKYLSATFVGNRTSLDNKFSIETYIIDKYIKPTKQMIEIEFLEKIREITKFNSLKELKNRIQLDIQTIKEL